MEDLQAFYSFNPALSHVAAGDAHSAVIDDRGRLYTFGSGRYGQLGTGLLSDTEPPTQVPLPELAISVAAGGHFTAVLTESGHLYTFGTNEHGQLGTGDQQNRFEPTFIPLPQPAIAIGAGTHITVILLEDGSVYICGQGRYGQLGQTDFENRLVPTRMQFDQPVVAVDADNTKTVLLTEGGEVYYFGSTIGYIGSAPQVLGATRIPVPERVTTISADGRITMITAESRLYLTGRYFNLVDLPYPVVQAAAESIHLSFISDTGLLYVIGRAWGGRVGMSNLIRYQDPILIPLPSRATEVAAGMRHSIVLTEDGRVYYNASGVVESRIFLDPVEVLLPASA